MFKKDEVSLCPLEERHLPFLVKWGNVGGLTIQAKTKRRTNIVEQIEQLQHISNNPAQQVVAIHLKNIGQPVGICEFFEIDWINRTCFINLYIEDKVNVLGIHGFKIVQLILNYVFKRLGLYKVSVNVLLESNIETALFKQSSFKTEVRKRKHAFVNGKYKTVLEMSLLKHEFEIK